MKYLRNAYFLLFSFDASPLDHDCVCVFTIASLGSPISRNWWCGSGSSVIWSSAPCWTATAPVTYPATSRRTEGKPHDITALRGEYEPSVLFERTHWNGHGATIMSLNANWWLTVMWCESAASREVVWGVPPVLTNQPQLNELQLWMES